MLLIGDAILGILWMFKFDRIMQEIHPMLKWVWKKESPKALCTINSIWFSIYFHFMSPLFAPGTVHSIVHSICHLFHNATRFRTRLVHEYGISADFTELWDRLQREEHCCGVTGSQVSSHKLIKITIRELNWVTFVRFCRCILFSSLALEPWARAKRSSHFGLCC